MTNEELREQLESRRHKRSDVSNGIREIAKRNATLPD